MRAKPTKGPYDDAHLILCILLIVGATAATGTAATRRSAIPPASSFSARVDNQWVPLRPGTRYVYTGVKDGKPSRNVMTVTHATRTIAGVPCVVVHDRLYLRGRLGERTTDWYSQDARGNVWYFGEDTAELDAHGRVSSTAGTWTAGVNGAAGRATCCCASTRSPPASTTSAASS